MKDKTVKHINDLMNEFDNFKNLQRDHWKSWKTKLNNVYRNMKLIQNNITFKDLRNFCKIMKWIGYSRLISEENSKLLYFRLVAALCLWLSKRLDQLWEFIDNINEVRKLLEIFAFLKLNIVLTKVNI